MFKVKEEFVQEYLYVEEMPIIPDWDPKDPGDIPPREIEITNIFGNDDE